ncbi:hypothetical protein GQ43DRAFT_90549 [Delitschia confertaspora ATCC 74209]|uniref:Uncharacterized protein n=1 Tax=Delitschia confertaspora ATCC 74209 TaxID=1513339 RepID=A0A9P4JIG0_9PLEO|nr:hypothetical protein GQ43DRAFT_90549 [Delitschia confertaspora ATCC 74209]
MRPGTLPFRASSRPICQLCDHILQQPSYQRRLLATKSLQTSVRVRVSRAPCVYPAIATRTISSTPNKKEKGSKIKSHVDQDIRQKTIRCHEQLQDAESQIQTIISSPTVPTEDTVLKVLRTLGVVATSAIEIQAQQIGKFSPTVIKQSSAASLLSLDEEAPPVKSAPKTSPTELPTPNQISSLAYELMKHPTVFITPKILSLYVQLQALLRRPKTLPEVFKLYAEKPIPREGSSPPSYTKASPNSAKAAISADTAEKALTAAIEAKDMGLALDVIETSYAAPAFKRAKLMRKVALPAVGVAATPLVLYELAQQLSLYSTGMDPDTLANYAFAGLMSYCLFTGTLGFVALTTANDQMDRVVWVPGMRLRERWMREEERAALDRIAGAWGFKEVWKRGEEEGEEWEGLREWCYLKGMILDKTDLMEGMK